MKQCGLDGIRAPYDANNDIRDACSTTDIIMISLRLTVLFCFCIYRLECSKAKKGLGWMERLLNASLLRALLWSSRLILKDNPNHLYYIEHIGIGS